MIDLNRLKAFLAVAKYGGFREAAKKTGISQSTMTQHIKRLEHSLKAVLIERSNARSTLTAQGLALLPYAESLLSISERASQLFEKKTFVIGASSNVGIYLLQSHLKSFQNVCPSQLDITIADNASIADKLQNLEIDIAVMEWWDNRPGFVSNIWRSAELVLIVPPDHPWSRLGVIPRSWLKGERLLGGEAGTGTGRVLVEYFGEDMQGLTVAMQLGSTEAVKHAVQAGLGISLVMIQTVMHECRAGRLSIVRIEDVSPQKIIYIIRRDNLLPDAIELNFTEFLLSHVAGNIDESLFSSTRPESHIE